MTGTAERDRAIVLAHRGGLNMTRIGEAHGLTKSRVQQIVARAAGRERLAGTAAGELSTRLRNAILKDGCRVDPVAVRAHFTMKKLVRVPNIGEKCIRELNEWLLRHGQSKIE